MVLIVPQNKKYRKKAFPSRPSHFVPFHTTPFVLNGANRPFKRHTWYIDPVSRSLTAAYPNEDGQDGTETKLFSTPTGVIQCNGSMIQAAVDHLSIS